MGRGKSRRRASIVLVALVGALALAASVYGGSVIATPISSDPKYLAMVACDINDRPRKIHNWKKPSELFTELVESNASTG